MPKYSILIPNYNKANYLKKYLCYALNQTYPDYEVIVVDDNSTDDSLSFLSEIKNPRLKVFANSTNLGIGATRNILISHAEGQYIIFVDPDDFIEPELLAKIDEANINLDIIRFQNVIEPMTEKQKLIEDQKDKYRMCCVETDIISGEEALLTWCLGERKINTMPWTYAMKKSLFIDVSYPCTSMLEDFAITPFIIAKSKRVKAIPFVGYHYLRYDDSLSIEKTDLAFAQKKILLFKEIIHLAEELIKKTDISREAQAIFIKDINNRYLIRKKKVDALINTHN